MNRAGNFADVVEWLRFALAFSFVVAFTLLFINNWDSQVQSMNESVIPNISKLASANVREDVPVGLDYLFVFVFVAFVSFSVVAARLIPSSPKFILVSFFAFVLIVLGSMFIANIWNGFYEQSVISTALASMVFLPFFMDKIVFFTLGYVFLVAVALLTKRESDGEVGGSGGLFG